ncbi:hypothetical protein [Caballeronia sp. BCC1704]|uniref:hypothetical protein n=1 Tax=Caballeronia sp. BCC1704 TaxID=2676300 RepID=UPI00158C0975|nr:hypothetical protein [Caballeronia sp. BCC1704]
MADIQEIEELVQRLHRCFEVHTASVGIPSRSVLHPPAAKAKLGAADSRFRAFPPSYQSFLSLHNGWEGFEMVSTLIGVDGEHTDKALVDIGQTIDTYRKRWAERFGSPTEASIAAFEADADLGRKTELDSGIYLPNMLVFGTDFAGKLYYFYPPSRNDVGEMTVVTRNIYGKFIRQDEDFPHFLKARIEIRERAVQS